MPYTQLPLFLPHTFDFNELHYTPGCCLFIYVAKKYTVFNSNWFQWIFALNLRRVSSVRTYMNVHWKGDTGAYNFRMLICFFKTIFFTLLYKINWLALVNLRWDDHVSYSTSSCSVWCQVIVSAFFHLLKKSFLMFAWWIIGRNVLLWEKNFRSLGMANLSYHAVINPIFVYTGENHFQTIHKMKFHLNSLNEVAQQKNWSKASENCTALRVDAWVTSRSCMTKII